MSTVAAIFVLAGAVNALIAGVGLLTLRTPFARFHAAGKASPVAFLLVAIGGAFEVGWVGAIELTLVVVALVITLPASTHLLFRATHRTTAPALSRDDLAAVGDRPDQATG